MSTRVQGRRRGVARDDARACTASDALRATVASLPLASCAVGSLRRLRRRRLTATRPASTRRRTAGDHRRSPSTGDTSRPTASGSTVAGRPAGRADRHGRRAGRDPRALRPRAGARVRRRHHHPRARADRPARRRRGRVARRSRGRSSSSKSADVVIPRRRSLAHGIGGAKDLPDPARAGDRRRGRGAGGLVHRPGAGVAHAALRRRDAAGRPAPAWLDAARRLGRGSRVALRVVGLLVFGCTSPSRPSSARTCSPTRSSGCSTCWCGSASSRASLLFGPVWQGDQPGPHDQRRCSPGSPAATRTRGVFAYPERLGYWPAALGLFAFVWIELVYPHGTELGPVRLWCAVYVAVMLIGGALFGNTFYERADPFEVYSTPGRQAVGLGPQRRRPAAWSAARWPTSTRRSAPGLVARRRRCCSAARRSTRSGLRRPGCGSSRPPTARRTVLNNLALLGFCARRRR